MRTLLWSLAFVSWVHAPAWADSGDPPTAAADARGTTGAGDVTVDAKAIAVGKQLWNALGGDAGWNRARYFRFDFVVERGGKQVLSRAHYWDRFTGRYRVDGVDEVGARHSAYFNVNTRSGDVWLNGARVTDAAQTRKWLDQAYEAFINDSYWLLAPYKLFDPGVRLSWAGEDKGPHGEICDVLKLSFASVGLTPKDVYWQLVDRATHLVVGWRFILDGGKGPPSAFSWSDWHKVGPIRLASTRTALDKPSAIKLANLAVSDLPDEAALTPPK